MKSQLPGYGPPAPVQVFQWEDEFAQLLDIYRERAPKRTLEIGTYHGGTLYHFLTSATEGALVVSVDSYAVGVDNRAAYGDWCPPGVSVVAIAGNSHDAETVEKVSRYAPYDFVWIDAGHKHGEVSRDWRLYGPMCAAGGLVCFHDITPSQDPSIEVDRLWADLKTSYDTFEIVAEPPERPWGGIGCVRV